MIGKRRKNRLHQCFFRYCFGSSTPIANTPIANTTRVNSRVIVFIALEFIKVELEVDHRLGLNIFAPSGPMMTPKRNAQHASPI